MGPKPFPKNQVRRCRRRLTQREGFPIQVVGPLIREQVRNRNWGVPRWGWGYSRYACSTVLGYGLPLAYSSIERLPDDAFVKQ